MNGNDGGITWPSAVVASMVTLLVGGITITAILRYNVDDALKMWAALGSVVGLITGAFVTYFFTRKSVEAAKETAMTERKRADVTARALTAVAGSVDRDVWPQLVNQMPDLRRAVDGSD